MVIAGWVLGFLGALAQDPAFDTRPLQPFLKRHCADCHMDGSAKGGLDLDTLKPSLRDAETFRRWELVHDRVRAGEMPPPKEARPDAAARDAFLAALDIPLARADRAARQVVFRRLNRNEYENTVRELFGVHVDVRHLLPEDAVRHGFDNIGDALAASSELVHAYLEAADAVIDAALGPDREPKRMKLSFPISKDVEGHIGDLFRATPDGTAMFHSGYSPSTIRSFRPQDPGSYRIRIHARGFQSEKPVTLVVHAGDVITNRRPRHLVGHFDLPPDRMTVVEFEDRFQRYDTFHPKPFGTPGATREKSKYKGPGIVIGDIEIEGPLEAWPPPSRRALLGGVDPALGTPQDLRGILARLLPRALRRPGGNPERWVALGEGRPFLDALRIALKGLLCSPGFLFLDEPAGKDGVIDGPALAARLSYFLWSSMPDAELRGLAEQGELAKPDVLRAQTERLLGDPRARAFVKNFAGQWLGLRDIDFTEPDAALYPEFDELLKVSMVRESELFFEEILRADRPLLEFIDADWTMLNARLARHYGIGGVEGQEFRRVTLPAGGVRGGVLTQAAVLKVTANGTNTSPVLRGVWVLNNIVGRPVPPPPAGVPAVEPDIRGTTTLREQLAKHRNVPSCAGCHAKIDPPGFALESFDVVGGWRDWYRSLGAGKPVDRMADAGANVRVRYKRGPDVDPSGELAGGTKFADIRGFKKALLEDKDAIARCLAGKLLAYGIGRGAGYADRPGIERMVAAVRTGGYGFRSLLHEVAQSEAFRRP